MAELSASSDQTPTTGADARLAAARREVERAARRRRWQLLAPAMIVIGVFGLFPLTITLIYSFLSPGTYGGVTWKFSTNAYVQFLFDRDIFDDTLSFSATYLNIYARSVGLAFVATVGALIIGFPTAYFIASKPPSQRNLWLFLITLPFWTNLLIRTYAILLIIRDEGIVNLVLMDSGITSHPVRMLYTNGAIFAGLIYSYLPFMVLPIYTSLEKLDFRLVEAGYDLYANRLKVLRHVIIPMAKPGIVAGSILVFIPALGAYITPTLLGGGKQLMIGNLIALQFGGSRNWPFGAAAALILMVVVMAALILYVRSSGREGSSNG